MSLLYTGFVLRAIFLCVIAYTAFTIRLRAVTNYGRVIHEFDPWSVLVPTPVDEPLARYRIGMRVVWQVQLSGDAVPRG